MNVKVIAWTSFLLFSVPFVPFAGPEVRQESHELVHVVDVNSISVDDIEELYSLPQVEGWVEFGNTTILVGPPSLTAELRRLQPALPYRTVPGNRADLRLACLEDAVERLREDDRIVAGLGRHAVVLLGSESAAGPSENGAHSIPLAPVPWNTIVVRRPDRIQPSVFAAGTNSALIDEAVGAIEEATYDELVNGLIDFGTRYTLASSFPEVTDYVADEFRSVGLTPTLEPFQFAGKTRHNVIAELPGSVTPQDVYVVCGHYDSTSNPTVFAPGADDNASGAAGVIEMARVLSAFRFDSTIRFIAFAGEEQGAVGSAVHVNELKADGELSRVKGVINMDMIAYMNTPVMDVLIEGSASASQQMMSLLSSLVPQYTNLVPFTSISPCCSDHMPYVQNGVNAVMTIEYEPKANPNYHSPNDTFDTLTLALALDILQLNVAAISTSAGINGYSTRGTVTAYGLGLGGANIGSLGSPSFPNIGSTLMLNMTGFDNSNLVHVVIAGSQASQPAFGGTLLVDLGTMIGGLGAAVSDGQATIEMGVPANPSLVGATVHLQAGGHDPTQPARFAMSNGLTVTIGQ